MYETKLFLKYSMMENIEINIDGTTYKLVEGF